MEVIVFDLGQMTLTTPEPGTCPQCAVVHEPELPHMLNSLFYQMKFHQANGRWPTREDAFAHVAPELRAEWEELEAEELAKRGQNGP